VRKRWLGAGFLGLCLGLGAGIARVLDRWQQPATLPDAGYTLTVGAGESLATLSRRLEADGIIDNALLLDLYGRYTGLDERIHRGEYHLSGAPTAAEILDQLVKGAVIEYQVTLPEGITLGEALAILGREEALDAVLEGPRDPRLLALAPGRLSAEGLFLPETYRYRRGESDWALLQRAHAALEAALAEAWAARDPAVPLAEPYEALVLASIVERETGVASERGRIAGVFARRLQRDRSHTAAAGYLAEHLDHPNTTWGCAQASLAAGRELEAAKQLRAHGVGRYEEIDLLYRRGHWREALERAHRYERPEWIAWLEREIAQRERLLGRGRRAWTVTVVALLVVAAGAFVLWRLAPRMKHHSAQSASAKRLQ